MNEVVIIDPKEFGLEENQALEIKKGLNQILEERQVLIESYKDVIELEINQENIAIFKDLRLKIRDNRTKGIITWHRVNKEFYLRGGQFVDAIKNKEIAENERMEENLLTNEKHFENLEIDRLRNLQIERVGLLLPYFDEAEHIALSAMDQDVFEAYLTAKKTVYEAKIATEQLAEQLRIETIKQEQLILENQRLENEKLKLEAEQREKEIQAERLKVAKEREIEQAKIEAERKKQAEINAKIQDENNARLESERKEKQRLQDEINAKAEAENKIELERLAELAKQTKEAEKLAKAPVKKQLSAWVNSFEIPKTNVENELSIEIIDKFEAFKNWALNQILKL